MRSLKMEFHEKKPHLLLLSLLLGAVLHCIVLAEAREEATSINGSSGQIDLAQRKNFAAPPTAAAAAEEVATSMKQKQQQTNERFNLIESDENGIYLLGLFDIHQSNPRVPFKCGPINIDAGESHSRRPMQNMAAFQWAIEQVNADTSLLPGVKLGSLVMDTCSSFLRTNQQLANLLHGASSSSTAGGHHQQQQQQQKLPQARQIAAIVADQADWQSVEAVTSMASALSLVTFVTQSRSTKLSEFARRYQQPPAMAVGALASNGEAPTRGDNTQRATTSNLVQQQQQQQTNQQFESLLNELLGVSGLGSAGKLSEAHQLQRRPSLLDEHLSESILAINETLPSSGDSQADLQQQQQQQQRLHLIKMLLGNELLADALATLTDQMGWNLVSLIYDDLPDMIDLHDELARQLFARNTQLALDEQVPFGAQPDAYDKLLAALARKSQSGARVVISLLGTGSARNLLDSLRHLRASRQSSSEQVAQINSLLWITVTDREPYYSFAIDALGTVAITSSSSLLADFKLHYDQQLAMGGITSRNNSTATATATTNRWWAEYLRAILMSNRRESAQSELLANECAKWQEPRNSPLQEKCRSLTLASIVQTAAAGVAATNKSTEEKVSFASWQKQQATTTTTAKTKVSKYLAAGWEHNGMDTINSVLAVANGLESVRQALCPDQQWGLCERMRALLRPVQTPDDLSQQTSPNNSIEQMPTISELVHNELLRSTFQLADGRMFSLDESTGGGGDGQVASATAYQLEARLKLYNLRFLRQNSIGFVKFGQFDAQDGLVLNQSKALHYPNLTPSASPTAIREQAVPLDQIQSTCTDETKCLIMGAFGPLGFGNDLLSPQSPQQQHPFGKPISEEELAAGVNSLFKLDHPLMMATASDSAAATPAVAAVAEESVQTMRSQTHMFAWPNQQQPTVEASDTNDPSSSSSNQQAFAGHQKRAVNVIVLLPLHRDYRSLSPSLESDHLAATTTRLAPKMAIDEAHAFQQLVALAYAQTQVNKAQAGNSSTTTAQVVARGSGGQQQIELTTTVIDYRGSVEFAGEQLAALLRANSGQSAAAVAIVDFDSRVGVQVDRVLREFAASLRRDGSGSSGSPQQQRANNLLHLSIAKAPIGHSLLEAPAVSSSDGNDFLTATAAAASLRQRHANESSSDDVFGGGGATSQQQQEKHWPKKSSLGSFEHLRVDLLPGKANEIQALVKLIGSMPNWRLVHLIYTDEHDYRDEFVRRANEANICVSKLIWIPSADHSTNVQGESTTFSGHQQQQPQSHDSIEEERQKVVLDMTRHLFEREFYDYSNNTDVASFGSQRSNPLEATISDPDDGLNSTRILVLLASSSDATNRLILEAATETMLEDYVWVTTHEWLTSVEMPVNRGHAHILQSPASSSEEASQEALAALPKLPRYLLSSQLESHDLRDVEHQFKHYFAHLTPALHAPLPTIWLDDFWQQHFKCSLPIAATAKRTQREQPVAAAASQHLPVCHSAQRMEEAHQIQVDDRVQHTIRAIESICAAAARAAAQSSIAAQQQVVAGGNSMVHSFVDEFKRIFEGSLDSNFSSANNNDNGGAAKINKLKGNHLSATGAPQPLVGFNFVHRIIQQQEQQRQQQQTSDIKKKAAANESAANRPRRINNRNLSQNYPQSKQLLEAAGQHHRHFGRLVKIGRWRANGNQLILTALKQQQQQKKPSNRQHNDPSRWSAGKLGEVNNGQVASNATSQPIVKSQFPDDGNANNSTQSDGDNEQTEIDVARQTGESLGKLGAIKSRCMAERTCALCKQQIGQTLALIEQEEARLMLRKSSHSEPKVISSILSGTRQATSSSSSSVSSQSTVVSSLDAINFAADSRPSLEKLDTNQDNDKSGDTVGTNWEDSQEESGKEAADVQGKPGDKLEEVEQQVSEKPSSRHDSGSHRAMPRLATGPPREGQPSPEVDSIQASASSLFDGSTSRQIAAETRLAYSNRFGPHHHHGHYHGGRLFGGNSSRQMSAVIMSILSLVGVACMVASMTYFYPNMLDKSPSAACWDEDYYYYGSTSKLGQGIPSLGDESCSLSSSVLGNINDYFMLTGLLMLYSINIAYLLPATLGVCWFRRIGLALSYTVMFGAILVKVLACYSSTNGNTSGREHRDAKTKLINSKRHPRNEQKGAFQRREDYHHHHQHSSQIMDPIEESVEVTFESLPHDFSTGAPSNQQQQSSLVPGVSNIAQQGIASESGESLVAKEGVHEKPLKCAMDETQASRGACALGNSNNSEYHHSNKSEAPYFTGLDLIKISLGLIFAQFASSLVWLIEQPPEPTLYFSCWHCASLGRSPIVFLYEPLLCLIQPAIVLIFTWLLAIVVYKRTSQNEEKFRHEARRQLLMAGQQSIETTITTAITFNQVKCKQSQLDGQLREAKSLVMTTTLLVLTWSMATLNMISSSHRIVNSGSSFAAQAGLNVQTNPLIGSPAHVDDQTLVYANLISGALVFSFLFIYRLNLFKGTTAIMGKGCRLFPSRWRFGLFRGRKSRQSSLSFAQSLVTSTSGRRNGVLKFDLSSASHATPLQESTKWLGQSAGTGEGTYRLAGLPRDRLRGGSSTSSFFGSQFSVSSLDASNLTAANRHQNNNQEEMLRLQQFNSYGTYSMQTSDLQHTSTTASAISLKTIADFGKQEQQKQLAAKQSLGDNKRKAAGGKSKKVSSKQKSSNKNNGNQFATKTEAASATSGAASAAAMGSLSGSKLQRRQSNGSVASSTVKLMRADDSSDEDDRFDTISCAMSVASNSTSQLQGNDLYPIDCSIQMEVAPHQQHQQQAAFNGSVQPTSEPKQLAGGSENSGGAQA